MKKIFLPIFLLAFNINAQINLSKFQPIADSIKNHSLNNNIGYNWLSELSQIGSRPANSKNFLKAIDWAKNKFEEIGVDTIYTQEVTIPNWIRNDIEKAQLVNSKGEFISDLTVASLGGSKGAPDGIRGKILEVKSFEELQSKKSQAQGKIIFFNRSFNQTFKNTFRGYGEAVNQRTQGAIEADKVGGIAAIVRSVTTKNDDVPHVGIMRYADSLKQIPAVAISIEDADFLSDLIRKNPNYEVEITTNCENLPDTKSFNLIAEIKGTEFPEEIIVVGGHLDSWDKGDGAHDDGAPSIQTMEILHIFNKLGIKPKRTIRCVLFTAEEIGLFGGIEYGRIAELKNEFHLAAIESDRGAFTPRGFTAQTDSISLSKMQKWIPLLKETGIDWFEFGGSGPDISRIKNVKAGIGFIPDDQRYFDVHHSDNDTIDSVNPREMQLGTAAMAILTLLLSEIGL